MTAASLTYNIPALATPFDAGATNSTTPTPTQFASGWIPNVDIVAAEQQNYLHNASTAYIWLVQQLGLAMPFNPVAGASVVATKAGGIVSLRNNSTNATEFYVAKTDRAIGYTDPSLDPTNWQLINFNELSKYSAVPVTLASASTVNIGAALSGNVTISGTTTITAFDTITAGAIRYVTYSGAVTITYNVTSMQLIGGASRTNAVGDVSIFQSLGSGNWVELYFSGANNLTYDSRYSSVSPTIMATAASGILTATLVAPCKINISVANGSITTTQINSNLTINTQNIASSLGAVTGVQTVLGLFYSQQNSCLMLQNISGGQLWDGTLTPIPVVISASSTSATTFYSASGTTTTYLKLLGLIYATWTSGVGWAVTGAVWSASGASYIGSGMSSLGYGQTWQSVTRTSGVTYYNTTGRPIQIALISNTSLSTFVINGVSMSAGSISYIPYYFVIPVGASYSYTSAGAALMAYELR